MKPLQAIKTVWITPPGAIVDNVAFVTAIIDTAGFMDARIIVGLGALDIAIAALKLTESDDSAMSGATDVPGSDFSVLPLTLPSDTDDNKLFAIHVKLGPGRKRYLDLSLSGGNGAVGSYAVAWVDFYGASEHPNTAAERGFSQEAFV